MTTDAKIIGIVPVGSTVQIVGGTDPRHPDPRVGQTVTIVSTTGGVGGLGGGGTVEIQDQTGARVDVSRYTRVVTA